MRRLLIVEDEIHLLELLKEFFTDKGFSVTIAKDGKEAFKVIQESTFDIIFLDILLPYLDGFHLCEEIRKTQNIPIIILTALSDEDAALKGYKMGADDYICKPYSLAILYAKTEALLKRYNSRDVKVYQFKTLTIDFLRHKVWIEEKEIYLPRKEFELLSYLVQNKGRLKSRNDILDAVWGSEYEGFERSVDTHIKKLRQYLGIYKEHIKTIIGGGYLWEELHPIIK
ncbi:MAG: response regulator transcription factor [Anaeroplasmataceae bacterium]|nr:response regulator transcription factor [Anaeroplasmataceae bacterium]